MERFLASRSKTVAAALVTPLFFENDERGYFQTSLLTTPAIFVGSEFFPSLFAQARQSATTIFDAATSTSKQLSLLGPDIGAYENMVARRKSPSTSMQLAEEALARYMAASSSSRAARRATAQAGCTQHTRSVRPAGDKPLARTCGDLKRPTTMALRPACDLVAAERESITLDRR